MTAVFISYAKSNESEAKAICEAPRGVGDEVWRDDELPAHRSYAEVIEERLKAAKAVLVIWSAEAIKSQWVQSEADRARNDRKLVQLSIDGATPPMPFDRIHCADMNGWSGEADDAGWLKIVASLTELVGENSPRRESAERSARPESKLSICVLPFANMSDDPQQEYFSDGISEDIITDLSKVSALSVVARNTAFTFKGKAVEVPRLANQLGVSHVLEGSVRKAGGRVRITAQLIDGAAGDHLWAERWDRDLTDIFALQDEISQAIVAALKLRLLPKEKEAIERRGTDNVDSFNLYLMARQQLVAGNVGDATREEAIIRLCSRAVEIDPSYARAWALLAYGQHSLHFVRGRADDDGFAAAEKAISLDPTLAEPHALKGRVLYGLARREEARAEIDLALRLDPEAPEVLTAAGLLALVDQRLEDAERFYSKESLLDERDFSALGILATIRRLLGDEAGARQAARTCLERSERALARFPNNGHAMASGVMALAMLGEAEQARELVARGLRIDPENAMMRYIFARALAGVLGDREEAIAMLGSVLARAPGSLGAARTNPDFASIRDDPRFVAMVAEADAHLAAVEGAHANSAS